MLKASYKKYTLGFKFNAGTSRGILKEKDTWLIKVWDEKRPDHFGLGEAGPLKKLSIDDYEGFEDKLEEILHHLEGYSLPDNADDIYQLSAQLASSMPSIRFSLETALLDLNHGGVRRLFDNGFYRDEEPIAINGLIWMGHVESMLSQIANKIAEGFDCIKMKIGSLDFERECDVLEYVRRRYFQKELTLRVDANGAFKPDEAMGKLSMLSKFSLHSIEQPIAPGQHALMAQLCRSSPVPIALDEELIGINGMGDKRALLEKIRPQFIILKPTLIGGIKSSLEWISVANDLDIRWWITSALESNIGLNAISQFTAQVNAEGHQGLGTGNLYHNNIPSPLTVNEGFIRYRSAASWDLSSIYP
ncbi:o-succinylbenzoate synthase [Fulvivirga sp. M361]|uniref:o-succinylbenzoate synthase n=1 Tax=Fulvivirga sp. M361 TaxID=2594266 RepID=UPI0011799997|nr:o-succinylbenzoate synthase [Fulvivirga sp. M361]TRX52632.1 o-succinylbenzoate synthase [Fulvivirga sp. M361]